MEPTPTHERMARELVARPSGMIPQTIGFNLPPAQGAFLAAVKKIDPDADGDPSFTWTDTYTEKGVAYVTETATSRRVMVMLYDGAETAEHTLTPADAMSLGWALVALAAMARTEG